MFYSVCFAVSMAGIVVATLLLPNVGKQGFCGKTGLLSVFITGCITLLVTFCHMLSFIRAIRHDHIGIQSRYTLLEQDVAQKVACLQKQNEELSLCNSQLRAKIKDTEYPLEKGLNSLLLLLNDIYQECDEYGETYAVHLKKRISFMLESQGYEFLDYTDETIHFYSAYESNYEEDTVTQPALVNKKTRMCVLPGIVFLGKNHQK